MQHLDQNSPTVDKFVHNQIFREQINPEDTEKRTIQSTLEQLWKEKKTIVQQKYSLQKQEKILKIKTTAKRLTHGDRGYVVGQFTLRVRYIVEIKRPDEDQQ